MGRFCSEKVLIFRIFKKKLNKKNQTKVLETLTIGLFGNFSAFEQKKSKWQNSLSIPNPGGFL